MNRDTTLLIPVHNRRATTLTCLRRLREQGVFDWGRVVVIDDGSSDGTAAAVRTEFAEATVIAGDGTLWWTGAIAAGMREAVQTGATFVLWLNDDCAPRPEALRRLRTTAQERQAVVGGTCVLPGSDEVVYGGLRRRGFSFELLRWHPGKVEDCDALSGNLVCLPVDLVRRIGLPDARQLPHGFGDIDYTLRARAAGWPVLVDHGAVAEAVPNSWANYSSWLLSDFPLLEIWRSAWRKGSYGYFPAQLAFFTRHWGARGAVHAVWLLLKRIPIMLLRLVVPQRWLRRLWSDRSRAWQEEQRLRGRLERPAPGEQPPGVSSPSGGETPRGS